MVPLYSTFLHTVGACWRLHNQTRTDLLVQLTSGLCLDAWNLSTPFLVSLLVDTQTPSLTPSANTTKALIAILNLVLKVRFRTFQAALIASLNKTIPIRVCVVIHALACLRFVTILPSLAPDFLHGLTYLPPCLLRSKLAHIATTCFTVTNHRCLRCRLQHLECHYRRP